MTLFRGVAVFAAALVATFATAPVAKTNPRVFFLENAKAQILLSLTKARDQLSSSSRPRRFPTTEP